MSAAATPDDYQWLEELTSDRVMAWVKARNAKSTALLQARPEFAPTRAKVLELLNSPDKIPYFSRIGNFVYNLWTDTNHQRGLWRRTTLEDYRQAQPQWETVLDLDKLGQQENQSWVWDGANALGPEYRRCLISLSPGGSDASVVREFDLVTKQFVPGGFTLPLAKSHTNWKDANTIYVGTDFGPGSMTASGYPRIIKEWRRGTPLTQAVTRYEGQASDVSAYGWTSHDREYPRTFFGRSTDFYNGELFVLEGDGLKPIDKPRDAGFVPFRQWVFLELRSAWSVGGQAYRAGSLLVAPYQDYVAGRREFTVLFAPTPTSSLAGFEATKNYVIVNILDRVKSRLVEWTYQGNSWRSRSIALPPQGTISVNSLYDGAVAEDPLADRYTINYQDFLTPSSLFLGQGGSDDRTLLKQLPQRYDAMGMAVQQHLATSKDGTKVPYFVVLPKDFRPDGTHPTLLYGYGGFQVSEQPWYSGSWGYNWLQKGGVFVLANIRGGGEFGPTWHQAGIGVNKQRSYDDFIAIAEDLIARKITSPRRLGIMGGSNGGLLVGATFVQRPDLFNAVVCQVPLLDMRRYHRLLAGNSWIAEYGDPDQPEAWAYIQKYSPYHNVRRGRKYPQVFFTTSTKDDRVHPAHARKMVARMEAQGHGVLYFENIEGGHGGAADNNQRATLAALEFAYLWMRLG
jgi:prolyl oligopeptidase